jgi:hypothetical protein
MNDPVATPQQRPEPGLLLAPCGGVLGDLPERYRLGYSYAGSDRYRLERLGDLRLVSRSAPSQYATRRRKMIHGVEILLPGLAVLGCLDVLWSTGVI